MVDDGKDSRKVDFSEYHSPIKSPKEYRLFTRAEPFLYKWVERSASDMGMNNSQFIRFILNSARYEKKTKEDMLSVMDRHVWLSKCEKNWSMSGREVVSWCVDVVRVLDEGGLLELIVRDIFWGEKVIPESIKKVSMDMMRMKGISVPDGKYFDKNETSRKEDVESETVLIPRPDLGEGVYAKVKVVNNNTKS